MAISNEYSISVLRKAVKIIPEHIRKAAKTEKMKAITKFMEENPGINRQRAKNAVDNGVYLMPCNVELCKEVQSVNKLCAAETYMRSLSGHKTEVTAAGASGNFFG